jgi:hypothetical protein
MVRPRLIIMVQAMLLHGDVRVYVEVSIMVRRHHIILRAMLLRSDVIQLDQHTLMLMLQAAAP